MWGPRAARISLRIIEGYLDKITSCPCTLYGLPIIIFNKLRQKEAPGWLIFVQWLTAYSKTFLSFWLNKEPHFYLNWQFTHLNVIVPRLLQWCVCGFVTIFWAVRWKHSYGITLWYFQRTVNTARRCMLLSSRFFLFMFLFLYFSFFFTFFFFFFFF